MIGSKMFRDWPIKWKFTAVSVGVTMAVLLLASGFFLAAQIKAERARMLQEISVEAEVTGKNCAAALLFGDPATATEVLGALKMRKDIVHAAVFDAGGRAFALYTREGHDPVAYENKTAGADTRFTAAGLFAIRPIEMGGERIGSIFIEMGLGSYSASIQRTTVILLAGLLLALAAAFVLSLWLQRIFTQPISNLVNAAKAVSDAKDYSVRVAEERGDELGVLISVFNEMLVQIEEREARLHRHAEQLEETVRQRTSELSTTNERLEEELAERRAMEKKLIAAREVAEDATRLKDKFVSLVSHDLRSPISSNISGLRALAGGVIGGEMKPEQRVMVESMLRSNAALIEMIDMLLDMSRLKTGTLRPKPRFIHPHFVAADVIQKVWHIAEAKEIRLENRLPTGMRVFADLALYCEVLQNIVTNAIKFTPRGGTVSVFHPDDRQCGVAVRDTGGGIPEAIQADLFKHEVKTSLKGTAGESGTGLGMPFCRDIMEAHGGLISFETGGKGTTFYVDLPPVEVMVLVVDDQDASRGVMVKLLKEMAATILQAADGAEGFAIALERRPHLVITDINMDGADGFELLRNLRNNPETSDTPVIVVTSAGLEPGIQERAFSMGANDFVIKPLFAEDFIPRVRRFIG